jgi:hypothetical protein
MDERHITELRTLLDCVLPAMEHGETVEGRYLRAGTPAERRFYADAGTLERDVVTHWRAQRDCYVGVTLRRGHRGSAADISRAGVLWADVDYKLWRDLPDPAAAALGAVTDFPWTPSALVCSGGGLQPYWRLDMPYDVAAAGKERLERVNAALARAVCGRERTPDHVQDVARILRLPGTCNWKYEPPQAVHLVWCEPERVYGLDALEQALGVQYPWALRPTEEHPARAALDWGQMTGGDLRERAARGRIRRATLDLLDLPGGAGYQSPSEADAALAAGLIHAGLTLGEAYMLMRDSPRGQDALLRKGERHGEDYLRRTVTRAGGFAGATAQAMRFLRGA